MHAGGGRLVDADGELDRLPAQLLEQDLAELLADRGVVAVAGQVDQHADVAAVGVGSGDRPHRAALAGVHGGLGHRGQLVDGGVEQLVAGVALEGVHQRAAGVAAGVEAAAAQHLAGLLAQQRDADQRLGVRRGREEPEEAPLPRDLAVGAEGLHPDVVEVRRAVHGRARVGLRQHQQGALARLGLDRLGQPRERLGLVLVEAQDAQARAGHGTQDVLSVVLLQRVLAVAEEGEVVLGEPLEELGALPDLLRIQVGRRPAPQLGDDVEHPLAGARPVLDGLAHVAQHPLDVLDDDRGVLVGDPVDLDVHPRLAHRVVVGLQRPVVDRGDVLQGAGDVAADVEVRVHHDVHVAQLAGELHGQGVHEEGHVVGDDLDDAVPAGGPAVLGERGGQHPHLGGPLRAVLGQPVVAGERAVHVHVGAAGEVLRRDVAVVRAQQGAHLVVRRPSRPLPGLRQLGRLGDQVLQLTVVRRR